VDLGLTLPQTLAGGLAKPTAGYHSRIGHVNGSWHKRSLAMERNAFESPGVGLMICLGCAGKTSFEIEKGRFPNSTGWDAIDDDNRLPRKKLEVRNPSVGEGRLGLRKSVGSVSVGIAYTYAGCSTISLW